MDTAISRLLRRRRVRRLFALLAGGLGALLAAGSAGATVVGPSPPDISVMVQQFSDPILNALGPALSAVLPYAAAFTAFAIGISFIKGWIGRKNAMEVNGYREDFEERYASGADMSDEELAAYSAWNSGLMANDEYDAWLDERGL